MSTLTVESLTLSSSGKLTQQSIQPILHQAFALTPPLLSSDPLTLFTIDFMPTPNTSGYLKSSFIFTAYDKTSLQPKSGEHMSSRLLYHHAQSL
jgi:hypothetical protein